MVAALAAPSLGAGPDSVSWKINREIVVVLGWPAAVLMQLAHPLVLAGVLDHSVFVSEPRRRLERLHSTVESMLLLTFGTPHEVQQTADRINAIHDYVHGRLDREEGPFSAGTPYSAHDPELLRWVHATLIDVLPRTYRVFVGPLSREEVDAYCAEATVVESLLGMPRGYLPKSSAELRSYMDDTYASGVITVTDETRWLAGEVLRPIPLPGKLHWAVDWLGALPTIGLLPAQVRQAYNLSWGTAERACLRAGSAILRGALPLAPSLLRHWPASRR